jgi:DNA invertase Pin-like site-specific DNA recombinase
MSTDMQKYSIDNQSAIIGLYASTHGLTIVRTYADEGKSGLKISGRSGLQQLIQDVREGDPGFETILVYDVSRWGRFQDADESAYYEFICREAGVSVRYCAEEFENDGSLAATLLKTIKRAMAGEYSRELSNRVFIGKCNLIKRGFREGGSAGIGLRRMVIGEGGERKGILNVGEQKFLHTDRTILVPGPVGEIETVRKIFDCFTLEKMTLADIARLMNARGVKNGAGSTWKSSGLRDLLANEKYIGNNVFNRTSVRLKSKCVRNPPDRWVRANGVFEPIIDSAIFALAQKRLPTLVLRYTDGQLLDHISALWCRHGRISAKLMEKAPTCPSTNTFIRHFGNLSEALSRVGYKDVTQRPVYLALRKSIANTLIAQIERWGGTARFVGRRRQTRILVNDEILITVALAHWCYRTRMGKPRWMLRNNLQQHSDLVVLARYDNARHGLADYFFFPGIVLTSPFEMIFDLNHFKIESFRSDTLAPLEALFARSGLAAAPKIVETGKYHRGFSGMKIFGRSQYRKRNSAVRRILRNFDLHVNRMSSFIEKCNEIKNCQCHLETALRPLLNDRSFCKLLFDEGLDTLPTVLSRRLEL